MMKIAVIGAGGVGGYFGGKLAQAGHDVTFVARGEHLRAIQASGLQVKSILGDFAVQHTRATDSLGDIGDADLILLGIKAWQVREIAQQLRGKITQSTAVMPLQNGVMAPQELSEVLGEARVIGGLCRIISRIEFPGVINHFGVTPYIAFGELDHRKTDRVLRIKDLLDSARITSLLADDIQVELWNKFMGICVSGLLAVARSPYGVIRETRETRQMMIALLSEVHQVGLASGVRLGADAVAVTAALIDSYPYDSTSSLTRDVMEGRPSEIEYQNGTVVRLGDKLGIDVPVNRFIYNCIAPMEQAARARANQKP